MKKSFCQIFTLLLLLANLSGCSYMTKRGHDAIDIFDIGFTVTQKATPDFAAYIDFFGRTPLGFASVDATLYGMGFNRQLGAIPYTNHSWGVVAWGSEKLGVGDFDAKNPYQARVDQQDAKDFPRFNTGFVRMIAEDDAPPPVTFAACDKGIHLGYIGFLANCRPLELVDFILGWTTIDIMDDDDGLGAHRNVAK
jgi:hypothetical protein